MANEWSARVVLVLPAVGDLVLEPIEANALLEVAYVAMAIDRDVPPEELEAFRSLSLRLRGLVDPDAAPLSSLDVETLLQVFARRAPAGRELVRLKELAETLASDASRRLAFQIAFAMTLVDFNTTEEELALDTAAADAFGISADDAKKLRADVFQKLA